MGVQGKGRVGMGGECREVVESSIASAQTGLIPTLCLDRVASYKHCGSGEVASYKH